MFMCVLFLNCFLFCVCVYVFVIREELVTFCFFLRNNIAIVWNNSLSMCHQSVSTYTFISNVIFVPQTRFYTQSAHLRNLNYNAGG